MEAFFKIHDLYVSLPFLTLIMGGLLVLFVQLVFPSGKVKISFGVAVSTILLSLFFILQGVGDIPSLLVDSSFRISSFGGHLVWNAFTALYSTLALLCLLVIVLAMPKLLTSLDVHFSETYQLVLYIAAGVILLISSNSLITMFVSLELASLPLFVFAGWHRTSKFSNEAGIKYFLLSMLSVAFLLLGIAFLYGSSGSFFFDDIQKIKFQLFSGFSVNLYVIGFIFVFIGIGFKVAFFPLHIWVVDVYEGTITIFTTLMASIVKIVAIGFLFKLVYYLYHVNILPNFSDTILYLSVASMFYGNLAALRQKNLKRIFAFSSIAHAGYMLALFQYVNHSYHQSSIHSSLFIYLVSYVVAVLLVFMIIAYLEYAKKENKIIELKDIQGLSKNNPYIAFALSVGCLSFAGIPPLLGFYGKLYLLQALLQNKLYLLSILVAINSFIAIFYYARIVLYSYWRDNKSENTYKLKSFYPYVMFTVLTLTLWVLGVFSGGLYKIGSYVFKSL